jgi:S-DNA-T family DNA segregation ATPase FtsK/SpoIIIE
LGIGYGRAARLIDFMAEDGIVGQYNGSQAREILISLTDWERMQGLAAAEASGADTSPAAARRNRVLPEPWEESPEDEGEESDPDSATGELSDEEDEDADEYRAESA